MKTENYNKIMCYLDIIEAELNNVAAVTGHTNFSDFMNNKI